jgi:DNA-directed RNA polymerase subunit A'
LAKCQPSYARVGRGVEASWPAGAEFESEAEREFATRRFDSGRAQQILSAIPLTFVRDVLRLENTPEDMCILQSMLIGPTCIRPSISKRNSRGEDDLTRIVCDIIKHCAVLKDVIASGKDTAAAWSKLQMHVNIYHDKDTNPSSRLQRAVGPMKPKRSVMDRLNGKSGRFRRTIMGKRLNNCARCVITPDAECDVWVLKVPLATAMALTVAEVVNDRNKDVLAQCVINGMSSPGGAHFVQFLDGSRINLRQALTQEEAPTVLAKMVPGSVVHRMLRSGDIVLFNRQPTLHKMSIMAVEVRVDKQFGKDTMRMNTLLCHPYNADFDGDEMNMHVPQSDAAKAEARMLMHVQRNIMNGADNAPIIGCVQDTLTGIHILTQPTTTLSLSEFMLITSRQRYARQNLRDVLAKSKTTTTTTTATNNSKTCCRVPGHCVLNCLFPPSFHYNYDGVQIVDGTITCDSAPWTKSQAGRGAKSIMQALCADYGESVAAEWLSDVGRTVVMYVSLVFGLSLSLSDACLDDAVKERTKLEIDLCLADAKACKPSDKAGQLEAISAAMDAGAEAVRSSSFMNPLSGLGCMIRSGAKGTALNARQIISCVGQQVIGTGRPGVEGGRALSNFPKFTHLTDPRARGFVQNSYLSGLDPVEFYWHASAGRVGLADTACGTANTGYQQRRLQKCMEDTKSKSDGTIRNSKNHIVYFRYLDGFLPDHLEVWDAKDLLLPAADERLEALRRPLATIRQRQGLIPDLSFYIPFNIERYVWQFARKAALTFKGGQHQCQRTGATSVTPDNVFAYLQQIKAAFESRCTLEPQLYHAAHVLVNQPPEVLTPQVLKHIIDELALRITRCLVVDGHPVGSLSAAAISKDSTQKTLNSFHHTGDELLTGFERMKELCDQSSSAVCAVIAEPAVPGLAASRSAMERIAASLRPVLLSAVTTRFSVQTSLPLDLQQPLDNRQQVKDQQTKDQQTKDQGKDQQHAPPNCCCFGVFYLDREVLRAHQLTMLNILPHLKRQTTVRISASSLRRSPEPYIAFHFDQNTSADAAFLICKAATNLVVHGFAEVKTAEVKRRPLGPHQNNGGQQHYDIHCVCTDLTPFFLSDSSVFNLATLQCNHVGLVELQYGIEAAHQALFCEMKQVLCSDGHVNNHHIHLLSTIICRRGRMLAVTRHGMARGATDCMQRASFEQPKAVFVQSATFHEESRDLRNCPSTSTIIGSVVGIGTGTVFAFPGTGCTLPPRTQVKRSIQKQRPVPLPHHHHHHHHNHQLKPDEQLQAAQPVLSSASRPNTAAAQTNTQEQPRQKSAKSAGSKVVENNNDNNDDNDNETAQLWDCQLTPDACINIVKKLVMQLHSKAVLPCSVSASSGASAHQNKPDNPQKRRKPLSPVHDVTANDLVCLSNNFDVAAVPWRESDDDDDEKEQEEEEEEEEDSTSL